MPPQSQRKKKKSQTPSVAPAADDPSTAPVAEDPEVEESVPPPQGPPAPAPAPERMVDEGADPEPEAAARPSAEASETTAPEEAKGVTGVAAEVAELKPEDKREGKTEGDGEDEGKDEGEDADAVVHANVGAEGAEGDGSLADDADAPGLGDVMAKELRELSALLMRASGLAELHASGLRDAAADETPLPEPRAPVPALDGDEPAEYFCLEDGELVAARSLLVGERRGQRCMSLADASDRRWVSMESALGACDKEIAALSSSLDETLAAPAAWAEWAVGAQREADRGFDELEQMLHIQRQAAKRAIDLKVEAATNACAFTSSQLHAMHAAQRQQQRALRCAIARTSREAGDGWHARFFAAWAEAQQTIDSIAANLQARASTTAAAHVGEEVAARVVCTDVIEAAVAAVACEADEVEPLLRLRMLQASHTDASLLPPPTAPSFDSVAELRVLEQCFAASPAAEDGTTGAVSGEGGALLAAQREAIAKLNRRLEEAGRASAMLQTQLDAVQQELAQRPKLAVPPSAPSLSLTPSLSSSIGNSGPASPRPRPAEAGERSQVQVFSKAGVKLDLHLAFEGLRRLGVACVVSNSSEVLLESVQVMAAVPKYLKLDMRAAGPHNVEPGATLSQPLELLREDPSRPYKLKLRLEYASHGKPIVEEIVSPPLEPSASLPPAPAKAPAPFASPTPTIASAAPPAPPPTPVTVPPAPGFAAPSAPAPSPPAAPLAPATEPEGGWADFASAFEAEGASPPALDGGAAAKVSSPPTAQPPMLPPPAPPPPVPPPSMPPPPAPTAGRAPQDVVPLSSVAGGSLPTSTERAPTERGSFPASPRPSIDGGGSEWGALSETVELSGRLSRGPSLSNAATPRFAPAVDPAGLPKPAEMIKAEMGVVLGKTLGRQVRAPRAVGEAGDAAGARGLCAGRAGLAGGVHVTAPPPAGHLRQHG